MTTELPNNTIATAVAQYLAERDVFISGGLLQAAIDAALPPLPYIDKAGNVSIPAGLIPEGVYLTRADAVVLDQWHQLASRIATALHNRFYASLTPPLTIPADMAELLLQIDHMVCHLSDKVTVNEDALAYTFACRIARQLYYRVHVSGLDDGWREGETIVKVLAQIQAMAAPSPAAPPAS